MQRPPQVRATTWEERDGPTGCWSDAVHSSGEAPPAGRWRGPLVPIARWDGTDSEEILLSRETESIRTGGENQEGKPRTSGKWRGRVMWGECAGILRLPLQRPSSLLCLGLWPGGRLDSEDCAAGRSCALCTWLVSPTGATLRKSEASVGRGFFLP